jgi:uncharacterized protein (DUF1697 family)
MTIYIALLRGINVSGQKVIKMDALKGIFESMQYQNVKTYIQSGNVIFQADEDQYNQLVKEIEDKLLRELGYEVTVIIRTLGELKEIINQNPYHVSELKQDEKIYISFLSEKPTDEAVEVLQSFQNDIDDFRVQGREVYLLCRKGYGKTLFSNQFIEKKLGVNATTRNWNSVNKITAIGNSI